MVHTSCKLVNIKGSLKPAARYPTRKPELGGDNMIRPAGIIPRSAQPGSRHRYKLPIYYIPRPHPKCLIPVRWDLSPVLPRFPQTVSSPRIWHQSVEKKVKKCFCRISSFYRSSHGRWSAKKVFLKTLQYSQENTCVGVSLQSSRFAILLIRDTNIYVFLRILRNIKEHHFEEYLRTAVFYLMNKNPNNSSKKS